MNELKKRRIKTVLKYTWPFYIVSAVVIVFGLNFIFKVTHQLPAYKTLELFVSGEMVDNKKLENDILEKYKDKELKSFSCRCVNPSEGTYYRQLSVIGYSSSDIMIIPESKLELLGPANFALDINEELQNSYFKGLATYVKDSVIYGIEIDTEKTKQYFLLPNESCYMFLNGNSKNTGKYSEDKNAEHDNALTLVQNWGKQI